jgi:hypothetical protein
MNGLLHFQFWFGSLIVLGLLRRLSIVFAAEQGRKRDLLRRGYSENHEQRISVLIPFLKSEDYSSLIALLRTLADQNYPASKVTIHLVASQETRPILMPQALRYNVRVWEYPYEEVTEHQARSWIIDRCLAQGGNSLFVFLRATDMVKQDYFRHLVAKSLDSFVIQGYTAIKNQPLTVLDKVSAFSNRLFNRIDNAGRNHLGFSIRLMDSGWAVKQDVLEMIPYRRGTDLDNLEYTIRLVLENFKIAWAPQAVIYSESRQPVSSRVMIQASSIFNRLRLLALYGPRLLALSVLRMNGNSLATFVAILRPPAFTTPLLLSALAIASFFVPVLRGDRTFWVALAGMALSIHLLACFVARCRITEIALTLIQAPLAYVVNVISLPFGVVLLIKETLRKRAKAGMERYRRESTTRFNETIPSSDSSLPMAGQIRRPLSEDAFEEIELSGQPYLQGVQENEPAPLAAQRYRSPGVQEYIRPLPLSNGQKHIECQLKTTLTTQSDGVEYYQLVLEYKALAFSTASYRILDQAFYELHTKLAARGLTPIACGSCAYFYNPTADQPGALNTTGVCLQGKLGQEVSLTDDAVTPVSEACQHHTAIQRREEILRHWKESLLYSISPKL